MVWSKKENYKIMNEIVSYSSYEEFEGRNNKGLPNKLNSHTKKEKVPERKNLLRKKIKSFFKKKIENEGRKSS
jgi:hypothetical protein